MNETIRRYISVVTALMIMMGIFAFDVPDAAYAAAKKPARVKWTSVKRSGSRAVLKWKKANNAKKYQVFSRIKGAKWKRVKTLAKRTVKLSVKTGNTYQYKIRGINGKKRGRFSVVKTLKVPKKTPSGGNGPVVEPEPLIEILVQPGDVEIVDGQLAEFSVEARGEGISYQWYSNTTGGNASGTKIEGADQPVYSFTAGIRDNGRYFYCVISNESEKIKTQAALLTIRMDEKAYVISQTEKIDAYEGRSVMFEVEGYGVGKLTYQWYKNDSNNNEGGEPIEDAVNPTYQISRVYLDNSGEYYYCVVTDTIKKSGIVIKETQAVSEPIPLTVSVSPEHTQAVTDIKSIIADHGVQSTNTVTIAGLDFYVIAEENNMALLLAKQPSSWYDYLLSGNHMWNYDIAGASAMVELNTTYLNVNPVIDCIAVPTLHYTPEKRSVESDDDYYGLTKKVFLLTEADVTGFYNGENTTALDFTFHKSTEHIGKALPKAVAEFYVDGELAPWYVRTPYTDPDPRYPKCSRVVADSDGIKVEAVILGDKIKSYARPAFWVDISG